MYAVSNDCRPTTASCGLFLERRQSASKLGYEFCSGDCGKVLISNVDEASITQQALFWVVEIAVLVCELVQSSPAQPAVTKYHWRGGSNNKHSFLTVLEPGRSKIKMLAHFVPGESSLEDGCLLPVCFMAEWETEQVLLSVEWKGHVLKGSKWDNQENQVYVCGKIRTSRCLFDALPKWQCQVGGWIYELVSWTGNLSLGVMGI